jgi:hypothetical protein
VLLGSAWKGPWQLSHTKGACMHAWPVQGVHGGGRSFCSNGVVLCRGSMTAVSRFDHAMAVADDDRVSTQGNCMARH